MHLKTTRRIFIAATAGAALSLALAGPGWSQDKVTLSYLVGNTPDAVAVANQMVKDFEAANPDITINIETRPGGSDGDNIIKTRLATGEMTDIFQYNSGSLFHAINPEQNLVDLTSEPWQADVLESFKKVVTANGKIYGAPLGAAMAGGVLYNKKIYADLGLSVPKTWADFMANSEKIKAAGKTAVIQTFGTTWTSQLFVLGDFFNVLQAVPDFPEQYTANKVHYADTPAALKGFQHQADVYKAGLLNADFAAAAYEDGVRMVATGEGAQYPMLTFAITAIQQTYPENIADVGFFALPGDDASKNGATVWEPGALYIPKTTQHLDAAKKFLAFAASTAGCDSQTKAGGATGPYLVKGCTLPADVPPAVSDLASYFKSDATTAPALEFLSPVKGPALEQITVQVGSGISSPEDGAKLYDEDVKKEALQLGLPGW